MTFDKVDMMIYQPRRSDNYRGKQYNAMLGTVGNINNIFLNV